MGPSGTSKGLATKAGAKSKLRPWLSFDISSGSLTIYSAAKTSRNTLKGRILQKKQGEIIDDAPDSSLWEIEAAEKQSKAPLSRSTKISSKEKPSASPSKKPDVNSIWDIPITQEDAAPTIKKAEARIAKNVEPKPKSVGKKKKRAPKKKADSEDEFVPTKPKPRSKVSKKTTSRPVKDVPKPNLSTIVESISSWTSSDNNDTINGKTLVEESRILAVGQKVDNDNILQKIAAAAIDQIPDSQQPPMLKVSQSGIIKAFAVPKDAPPRKYSSPSPTDVESNVNEKTDSPIHVQDDDGEAEPVLKSTDDNANEEDEITRAFDGEDDGNGVSKAFSDDDEVMGDDFEDLEDEHIEGPEILSVEAQSPFQSSPLHTFGGNNSEDMQVDEPEIINIGEQSPLLLSPLQTSEAIARTLSSVSDIQSTPKQQVTADAFRSPGISTQSFQSQDNIVLEQAEDELELEDTPQPITAPTTPQTPVDEQVAIVKPRVRFEEEDVDPEFPETSPLKAERISVRPFPKLRLETLRSQNTKVTKVSNPFKNNKAIHDNGKEHIGDTSTNMMGRSKIHQQNKYLDVRTKSPKDSRFLSKNTTKDIILNTETALKQPRMKSVLDTGPNNKTTLLNGNNESKPLQNLKRKKFNEGEIKRKVEEMVARMKHKMEEEEQKKSKRIREREEREAKKRRISNDPPSPKRKKSKKSPRIKDEKQSESEQSCPDEQEPFESHESLQGTIHTESSPVTKTQKPVRRDIM
ncbi:hypothetical protein AA313_de0208943 [Arthrobotrys entomopaga]|nr:hypothetical protein AA313_de0208943 [Arthrobotrys entomopaga]